MQISLVARIVSLHENSTNYDMQVDDGTGRLEVKLYVDSDEDSAVSPFFLYWDLCHLSFGQQTNSSDQHPL